jgi:hypothetical protein
VALNSLVLSRLGAEIPAPMCQVGEWSFGTFPKIWQFLEENRTKSNRYGEPRSDPSAPRSWPNGDETRARPGIANRRRRNDTRRLPRSRSAPSQL